MTFLPIVERELRVSARRRAIYWTRALIALAAIIIGGCIFLANPNEPEQSVGPHIFLGLSILALCYCLLAGRWFTVDCLCEERREGTLGLLFLTDLQGHDVVLGKLAATSLNGFFSLLALLPVLAIPMMMGGVSNGQFWRVALVLVVTFLFSLALGIYGSATRRTLRGAAGINLALLFLFTVGIPLGAAGLMYLSPPASPAEVPWPLLYSSPIFAFVAALDSSYPSLTISYWCSVGLIFGLALLLVRRAGHVVPHSWQERLTAPHQLAPPRTLQRAVTYQEASRRVKHRRRLLNVNAFYWLALRDYRKCWRAWIFLGAGLFWWFAGFLAYEAWWFDVSTKITAALLLNTVFKLWISLEAGQQIAEDKKSGSLELLLSSPLTVAELIRGQWLALRKQFLLPMLAAVVFEVLFLMADPPGSMDYNHRMVFTFFAAGLLMLVADIIAIGWVAMHQALVSRSPTFAGSVTILRVLILPWILWSATVLVVRLRAEMLYEEGPGWKFYLGLWFIIGLATDTYYGLTARHKLRTLFRALAASRYSSAAARAA